MYIYIYIYIFGWKVVIVYPMRLFTVSEFLKVNKKNLLSFKSEKNHVSGNNMT